MELLAVHTCFLILGFGTVLQLVQFSALCKYENVQSLRQKRSIGGTKVLEKDYPFVVALHNNYHQYMCAGSIITRQLVLTASHCVTGNRLDHVRVLSDDGRMEFPYNIYQIIAYPPVNGIYHNDIAILILSSPIQKARAITLIPKNWKLPPGAVTTAFGWGKMEDTTMPSYLRRVDLPITRCTARYLYQHLWICTDSSLRDVCTGDSGGPLVWNNYLVGIASSISVNGCRSGEPSTFAEVAAYREWIDSYIRIYP